MKYSITGLAFLVCILSITVSCDMFSEDSAVSTRGTVLVRFIAEQGSGVDTVTLGLGPVSAETETVSYTLDVTDAYVDRTFEFDKLAAGEYRLQVGTSGTAITDAQQLSDVTVTAGGVMSARVIIGSGAAVSIDWLSVAGLTAGISIASRDFDAAYYKASNDFGSSENLFICTASGNLRNLYSFNVRYPDGLYLGTSESYRAPYIFGIVGSTEAFLIAVRYSFFSSGDIVLTAKDFNGAAVSVSDNFNDGWNDTELLLSAASSNIGWSFSYDTPAVENYCVLIFGQNGYGLYESALVDGSASGYTATSPSGIYQALVFALDQAADAEYFQQVVGNEYGEYNRISDAPVTFARLNVSADNPKDFGIVYYQTVVLTY